MSRRDAPRVEVVELAWRPSDASRRAALLPLLFGSLPTQRLAPVAGVGTPRPLDAVTTILTVAPGRKVGV